MDRGLDLLQQSKDIADRYGLIPSDVTQSGMIKYLSSNPNRNYISYNRNIESAVDDKGRSKISTSSICSYMSPYTPNKRLSFMHSTGTGKTRKSLLAAMQYNRDITLVAVHSVQLSPFLSEMSPGGVIDKLYPWFRKRMDVITCKSVSAAVNQGDTGRLDYYFKGRVIIVDEVHHIRSTSEKQGSKSSLFDSMIDVLDCYKESIVFFLTATPLVDTATEMVGVYRLLKPGFSVDTNIQYLAHDLKGYVSSLEKSNLETSKTEVKCVMEEDGEQWRLYDKHQDDRTSVHSKTMAVSRFITLDDPDASECVTPTQTIVDSMIEGMTFETKQEYHDLCIEALKFISVKMYRLVQHLRTHTGYPKFIFDSWKKRGGVERVVDVLCMPAIGYHCVSSVSEAMDMTRGPKILALHRLSHTRTKSSVVKDLLDLYNSEDNSKGGIIELLIAAPMFAESMSLRTARESHVLMTPWNITGYIQILGRVNRRSSLWYLPVEDRKIKNYTYVLYKPDGSETVESTIERMAKRKYKEILPLLSIMRESSIEKLYNADSPIRPMSPMPGVLEERVNMRVRLTTAIVGYREVTVGIDAMLQELEKRGSIYELMEHISKQEVGYTRLISMAIQAIEYVYIRHMYGDPITPKQNKLINDMSQAFIKHGDYHMHVLYFSNDDTVEYQRLARIRRRIVRVLNTDTREWTDVKDQGVVDVITSAYDSITTKFSESISEEWPRYGFYITKFLLTSCHRLVRYRPKSEISRITKRDSIDKRKLSRGEKWQYYSKHVLIGLLAKFVPITSLQKVMMEKYVSVEAIFHGILSNMSDKGLVLVLPI